MIKHDGDDDNGDDQHDGDDDLLHAALHQPGQSCMPGRYSIVAECAFVATTACRCCLSIMFGLTVKVVMIMVTTCTSCPPQCVHQRGLKLCHGDRYHRC